MSLHVVTAGESHGPGLTAVIEGLPSGIPVDESLIRTDLARRQLKTGAGGRMAIETDAARILAGVMEGRTTVQFFRSRLLKMFSPRALWML